MSRVKSKSKSKSKDKDKSNGKNESSTHSRISPSGLARVLLCPGSVQMCEQYAPEQADNQAALIGTRRHEHMAHVMRMLPSLSWPARRGLLHKRAERAAAEDVAPCLEAFDGVQGILSRWSPTGYIVKVEQSYIISKRYDVSGTIDLAYWDWSGSPHVIDYKFGAHPVEAEGNPQLMAYMLGLCSDRLSTMPTGQAVYMHIVQPGASPTVKTAIAKIGDLLMWWSGPVTRAIDAALSQHWAKHCHASEEACRWCRAAGVCRAYASWRNEAAARVFGVAAALPQADDTASPALSADEIMTAYRDAQALKAAISAVEAAARNVLAAGPRGGYRLTAPRSRRAWRNEDDAALWAYLGRLAADNPTMQLYTPAGILSPRQMLQRNPQLKDDPTLARHVVSEPQGAGRIVPARSASDVFADYIDNDDG